MGMPGSRLHPFVVVGTPLTSAPLNPSAAIELADINKGFLPNRLTTAQRDAIEDPPNGLLIYNTDTSHYEGYNGSAWVTVGGGGSDLSNPFTDDALALWASDVTSGYAFDSDGLPQLVDGPDGVTAGVTSAAGADEGNPGFLLSGTGNFVGLAVTPVNVGSSYLELDSYFDDVGFPIYLEFDRSRGSRSDPTPVQNGDIFGNIYFYGNITSGSYNTTDAAPVHLWGQAAEDFDGSHNASAFFIATTDTVTETELKRLWVGGHGNTYVSNGALALGNSDLPAAIPGMLILDPSGSGDGIAISALPASPYLGMMTVVNNALSPTIGSTVVAGGSAKAIVWWNGAAWTVMGK
jgi:hypothetical protein